MKVVSVEPTAIDVAYVYQCSNGHQHEVVTIEPRSVGGAANTR
jgi:hypothetical protein